MAVQLSSALRSGAGYNFQVCLVRETSTDSVPFAVHLNGSGERWYGTLKDAYKAAGFKFNWGAKRWSQRFATEAAARVAYDDALAKLPGAPTVSSTSTPADAVSDGADLAPVASAALDALNRGTGVGGVVAIPSLWRVVGRDATRRALDAAQKQREAGKKSRAAPAPSDAGPSSAGSPSKRPKPDPGSSAAPGAGATPEGPAAEEAAAAASSSSGRRRAREAEAEGPSPLDALPDELLLSILALAARRRTVPPALEHQLTSASYHAPRSSPHAWETSAPALARLSALSRRFRRLAADPSLYPLLVVPPRWRRPLVLPPDGTAAWLASRTPAVRGAVRSLALLGSRLDEGGVRDLRAARAGAALEFLEASVPPSLAPPRLTLASQLSFEAGNRSGKGLPLASLGELPAPRRGLYLAFKSTAIVRLKRSRDPWPFAGRPYRAGLAALLAALAPGIELLRLLFVPLFREGTRALPRLAPHLRVLELTALYFSTASEAVRAAGAAPKLERLTLAFIDDAGEPCAPTLQASELGPLGGLPALRALCLRVHAASLEFLRGHSAPRLELLSVGLARGADPAPLASLAPSLRALALSSSPAPVDDRDRRLPAALAPLSKLEALELQWDWWSHSESAPPVGPACWPGLRSAALACCDGDDAIPLAAAGCLAARAPGLRRLQLRSPVEGNLIARFAEAFAGLEELRCPPRPRSRVAGASARYEDEEVLAALRALGRPRLAAWVRGRRRWVGAAPDREELERAAAPEEPTEAEGDSEETAPDAGGCE
eukprot:tig00020614_g12131.t1